MDKEKLLENMIWRLIAESHRKYPDATVHWINAADLRAVLTAGGGTDEPAGD